MVIKYRCQQEWDPEKWDGLTEEEAWEQDPLEVLFTMGDEIASQAWRGGSWSTVYEYKNRFFVVDEVETVEYNNAREAFAGAGIGQSTYDEISTLSVAQEYEYLAPDFQKAP